MPIPASQRSCPMQLADLRAVLADVEAERRRLLDRVVVAARLVAERRSSVQLPRDLGRRRDVAGVGVARDERQRPLLAAAGDQDRRVGPAAGSGARSAARSSRTCLPVERLLVAPLAVPHPQADLHRLLEHLEALAERRERQPEPDGLLGVVAGADARASPGRRRARRASSPSWPAGRRGRYEAAVASVRRRTRSVWAAMNPSVVYASISLSRTPPM